MGCKYDTIDGIFYLKLLLKNIPQIIVVKNVSYRSLQVSTNSTKTEIKNFMMNKNK